MGSRKGGLEGGARVIRKGRERKGEKVKEKREGGLELDVCPGAPQFLVMPLKTVCKTYLIYGFK